MKLAVVIPCFNHERYIEAAIESVLAQTRPPERFLVIDDGSKDRSAELIRKYEKDGVECIVQENAGAHATINRAIATVADKSDLISILNSDDIYEPDRFEKCIPVLEKDSEKSVVCSGLGLIDNEGNALAEDAPRGKWFRAVWSMGEEEGADLCEWLGIANFLATTSNIVARSKYLTTHPFRSYRYNHDYFFLAGAALRNQLALVPDSLLRYRVHDSNTINTDPAPLLREMLQMQVDLYREFAEELEHSPEVRSRFYRYLRASWDNVSSFHAGLFETLTAKHLATLSDTEVAELVAGLKAEELNRYPNSALVNEHDGESPLISASGLGEKLNELKRTNSAIKGDNTTLKELNRLRSELLASKWIALGRAFGGCGGLSENAGKTPQEKLEKLKAQIEKSGWANLGRRLGVVRIDVQ